MTEDPPKPRGFRLRRYPEHLHKYFPVSWGGKAGAKTPTVPAAPPEPDTDAVHGEGRLRELLGLTERQLCRARNLGLPFKQDNRRQYTFSLRACRRFLHEHEQAILNPPRPPKKYEGYEPARLCWPKLGLSKREFWEWVKRGMPHLTKPNGHHVFRVEECRKWLNRRRKHV